MLILALAAAAPQTGPFKTFGDWAVACDNTRFCEMTSLVPEEEDAFDGERPDLSVTRAAGPQGGLEVEMQVGPEVTGPVTIEIDGQSFVETTPENGTLRLVGSGADGLVRGMANGNVLRVKAGARALGTISLKGSAAALRFIDAEQRRVGTTTAAVATGAKPSSAVPAAPAAPKVTVHLASGPAAALSATRLQALAKQGGCEEFYGAGAGDAPEPERFALGGNKTLVLLPCGAGAYNLLSVPFVLSGGTATIARFDHAVGMGEADGPPNLVNATFDPETGRLDSYAKGRGIGDCGSAESFGWDGTMFRLLEARTMGECRGSANWLRVWRAEPVIRR